MAGEGECFFKAFVHTDAFAHGPPLDVNYDFSGASGRGEGVHASKTSRHKVFKCSGLLWQGPAAFKQTVCSETMLEVVAVI